MAQATGTAQDIMEPLKPLSDADPVQDASIHMRQPYRRQNSLNPYKQYENIPEEDDVEEVELQDSEQKRPQNEGLGLSNIDTSARIKRVPVGSRDSLSSTANQSQPISTPVTSFGTSSQATTLYNTPQKSDATRSSEWLPDNRSSQYTYSRQDVSSEADLISLRNRTNAACPTKGDVLQDPWSWITIPIMVLAVYTTLLSGIFLGIALAKPRYGEKIGNNGHLSFATATLLSALLSKTVELSFVTVFVALLGQVLSRRAFKQGAGSGGITIAEMTMRTWIMQPGTLITHFNAVRYAAASLLGVLALIATAAAMFYTTAAEALVSPKLKFGPLENRHLTGQVVTSFANSLYITAQCQTPITDNLDPGNACMHIEHAGQGFHNFQTYLADWAHRVWTGNTGPEATFLDGRPPPVALLFDNTTVQGRWINQPDHNLTTDSRDHNRLVQNVTMAFPHANVFNAARDPHNHIMQPEDLNAGLGEYFVNASVPAPTLDILCVGMTEAEVEPLILDAVGTVSPNISSLFNWNDTTSHAAPIFPKKPIPFNTIFNASSKYGDYAVYLLVGIPPAISPITNYVLCSVQATLSVDCTTSYHVTQTGGRMSVHCGDDPLNTLSYLKSEPLAPRYIPPFPDWKDVATEWIRAQGLNAGLTDSNSSIARMLTQMVPTFTPGSPTLYNAAVPTIGEALGVLAGCTLVQSTLDSHFIHYWNYSGVTTLKTPQPQLFNATVSYKDYASGGTQPWQRVFYLVLAAVFVLSCFCAAYLLWNYAVHGSVTDYTEPQNLFALAINSPPSLALSGACGAGPTGGALAKKWTVGMQRMSDDHHGGANVHDHPHFYVRCPDDDNEGHHRYGPDASAAVPLRSFNSSTPEFAATQRAYDKLVGARGYDSAASSPEAPRVDHGPFGARPRTHVAKKRRSRPRVLSESYALESPAVEQYMRLVGKDGA